MRSVRYFMPEGNPTLFSLLAQTEDILVCSVCKKEKTHSQLHLSVSRWADRGTICKDCASVGKFCSKCGKYKLFTVFPKGTNRGKTASYCYPCGREYDKENYDPRRQRGYNLYAHFRITQAEYDAMLEAQKGVCAICGQPETAFNKNGKVKPLSVDHNHTTGHKRALLCTRCNTFLGKIETNMPLVEKFFQYLDTYK